MAVQAAGYVMRKVPITAGSGLSAADLGKLFSGGPVAQEAALMKAYGLTRNGQAAAQTAPGAKFAVGDKCEVLWDDDDWYSGVVAAVSKRQVSVDFDDGCSSTVVAAPQLGACQRNATSAPAARQGEAEGQGEAEAGGQQAERPRRRRQYDPRSHRAWRSSRCS